MTTSRLLDKRTSRANTQRLHPKHLETGTRASASRFPIDVMRSIESDNGAASAIVFRAHAPASLNVLKNSNHYLPPALPELSSRLRPHHFAHIYTYITFLIFPFGITLLCYLLYTHALLINIYTSIFDRIIPHNTKRTKVLCDATEDHSHVRL